MRIDGKSSIAFRLDQLELQMKATTLLIAAIQSQINALMKNQVYLKG